MLALLAALGVVAAQCTGGPPAATEAAAALVRGWHADAHWLTAKGLAMGTTHCTFHVTNARTGAEPAEVAVRLLLPGSVIAATSRFLASKQLTPEVLGSNTAALVQRWLPGGPLVASEAAQESTAVELGRLVGRLHALPPPVHVHRGESAGTPDAVVWTHGDLHPRNILHGPSQTLVVIDLEAVAARPAVFDLTHLFFMLRLHMHLEGRSLEDAESFSLAMRVAFMEAYFREAGVPTDVDAWLWAIEERLAVELRLLMERGLRPSLQQLAAQTLPLVEAAVQRQVASRARGEKTQLIEQGAMALALREAGPTLRSELRRATDGLPVEKALALLRRRGVRLP